MKKTLLYASPFPPMKSGISEYSEALIYGLKKYFEITLLIDDYKLYNKSLYKDFNVVTYKKNKTDLSNYDARIYNIGNNDAYHSYIYECALKYPGMVILHDFILYYLFVGIYQDHEDFYSKIYQYSGSRGLSMIKAARRKGCLDLRTYKSIASEMPLNTELIESGNIFMTHSEYTRKHIIQVTGEKIISKKINHLEFPPDNIINKDNLFSKYKIPTDAFIIISAGFIAETKLNHLICEAVKDLSKISEKKICYIMVGEGSYADHYLDGKTIFKTGYVSVEEMNGFIFYSDICANLRNPSMGETSGALIRMMGMGKPCIVSDDAWFSEIPDQAVIKLKNEEVSETLKDTLNKLITDDALRNGLGEYAAQYIHHEHSLKNVSGQIYDFITNKSQI